MESPRRSPSPASPRRINKRQRLNQELDGANQEDVGDAGGSLDLNAALTQDDGSPDQPAVGASLGSTSPGVGASSVPTTAAPSNPTTNVGPPAPEGGIFSELIAAMKDIVSRQEITGAFVKNLMFDMVNLNAYTVEFVFNKFRSNMEKENDQLRARLNSRTSLEDESRQLKSQLRKMNKEMKLKDEAVAQLLAKVNDHEQLYQLLAPTKD